MGNDCYPVLGIRLGKFRSCQSSQHARSQMLEEPEEGDTE